jgi:hypothetical protein
MIADKIPDPGHRASFLEHVPENARTLAPRRRGSAIRRGPPPARLRRADSRPRMVGQR